MAVARSVKNSCCGRTGSRSIDRACATCDTATSTRAGRAASAGDAVPDRMQPVYAKAVIAAGESRLSSPHVLAPALTGAATCRRLLSPIKTLPRGTDRRRVLRRQQQSVAALSNPAASNAAIPAVVGKRRTLCCRRRPGCGDRDAGDRPDAALRFMAWLQAGLAEGTLRFNQPGAMVHFVAEGMLLGVTQDFPAFCDGFWRRRPRCRTSFASGASKELGMGIQRQLCLKAGWHIRRGERNQHPVAYAVLRGEKAGSLAFRV